MASFRKGKAEIAKTADAKGGARRFTPNIYWNDGDIRTLAFRTPADEIPKVRLHKMVRIPDDKFERGFRYETFLCRKDPSMVEESGGVCELCDTIGHDASETFVALAVELEPVKEGKKTTALKVKYNTVKKDDGTETDYPRWGMVVQGAKNFFSTLAAYDEAKGDITEVAFEVHRDGGGIGTKYHFFPEFGIDLPNMSELEIPELTDLLEQMGSEEKYATLEGVEPGSQTPEWAKGKQVETTSANGSDRTAKFAEIKSKVESY